MDYPKLLLHLLELVQELLLGLVDLSPSGLQTDLLGGPSLLGDLLVNLALGSGVGTDGGVGLLVHLLNTRGGHAILDEPCVKYNKRRRYNTLYYLLKCFL